MKKFAIILLAAVLLACNTKKELSATKKLHLTAKVWGFLKYYHPRVNEGNMNWDQQLVDIISKLDEVKTEQDLSALYTNWIESLGDVQPCEKCEDKQDDKYFDKNLDLSWLENELFSPVLIEKLQYIKQNRTQQQHFIMIDGATPVFINEQTYTALQWNEINVRLITLFRYWNVIEYFYPYKYVTDQKWDDVLVEMISRFQRVKTEDEYHLLLHELTGKLCDSHSFFITEQVRKFAGNKYIAARFKIIDNKAVFTKFYSDSLAQLDDLRVGDAVLKVDDTPILEKFRQNEKYINGSNESVKKLIYSFRWIFNGNTDSVKITIERDGKINAKTIRRYDRSAFNFHEDIETKWTILEGNIGYVNLEEEVVMEEDLPKMMKDLSDTKAIIFDLRNYPEFIWYELLEYFHHQKKAWATYTTPDLTYPGRFIKFHADSVGRINPSPYNGKVVILMDESTQSRAESFVMALQSVDGAITVGRQTSGADGNVADFTFFDDEATWITGLGVFYPDGRETQRIGIIPDIYVPLTVEDIRKGRDVILETAIEIATQNK